MPVVNTPFYIFNPKKDVIIEISAEDYSNTVNGNNEPIKHDIKYVPIERDSQLGKRFEELGRKGDNSFVSMPWGFFVKTDKGHERINLTRERATDMYEDLKDYFSRMKCDVYNKEEDTSKR